MGGEREPAGAREVSRAGGGPTPVPGRQTLVDASDDGPAVGAPPTSATTQPPIANSVRAAFALEPVPYKVWFPETEVGAVSEPIAVSLLNRGESPATTGAMQFVPDGDFALVDPPAPQTLGPREAMNVRIRFRPRRPRVNVKGKLRVSDASGHAHVDVSLRAMSGGMHAAHAGQGDARTDDWWATSAADAARSLDGSAAPDVWTYEDMLAAVLAARTITDGSRPGDERVRERVDRLLEPVAARLERLDDHHTLAKFGAGNVAGQAALDAAHGAVRTWMRKLAVGSSVQTTMLVEQFQMGAETIRALTGQREDAPTLRAFDRASLYTAIGAGALLLGPALLAMAAEEASLVAYAGRLASQRVVLWALTHPAAALALSESLLGFGIQIGEDGWASFWDLLHDPRSCFFVIVQVILDYLHVRNSMSHEAPPQRRMLGVGTELDPASESDLDGARERARLARAAIREVHDQAAAASADAWVDHLKAGLDPDASARLEPLARGASSRSVMDSFGGDLDAANASLGAKPAVRPPDTASQFCVGEPPKSGPARWKYLADPSSWKPERAALHARLLAAARAQASAFAETLSGRSPTLYAMRGNTAAGKTRAIAGNVPELAGPMAATAGLPHRAINPDNFKADLIRETPGATSSDVHSESSMLADRYQREVVEMRTADGAPASMLVDKRLLTVDDVRAYAELAKASGRKFVLFDVDAPLEQSLAGVLERQPGGSDPLPPFKIIADGFAEARANREAVIAEFKNAGIGSYRLYGTTPDGRRVPAMTIENGTEVVHDAKLRAIAVAPAAESLSKERVTPEAIDALTEHLPADRAKIVRAVLEKREGWTWKAALDAHSEETQ